MDYKRAMTGSSGAAAEDAQSQNTIPVTSGGGTASSGGTTSSGESFLGSNIPFQLTNHRLNGQNYLEWAQSM